MVKRIGLIVGLSPASTEDYYREITEGYNKRFGGLRYPEMVLRSLNLQEVSDAQDRNDWGRVAEIMVRGMYDLRNAGADFGAIASNTPHNAFDKIRAASPIPVLSIMDATSKEIKKDGFKTVGLLGTRSTMENGYFQREFERQGIKTIVPGEEGKINVNSIIFKELVKGIVLEHSKYVFKDVIRKLADGGAEGIILGCTEIPMLIKQEDSPVKTYNTASIHAKAILEYALH